MGLLGADTCISGGMGNLLPGFVKFKKISYFIQ